MPRRCRADVVVLDFYAGLELGHSDHYLRSLEAALEPWSPTVWAPYRDRPGVRKQPYALAERVALSWRAFRPPRDGFRVVILQNPGSVEKIVACLAAVTRRRTSITIFVLRRSGDDAHTWRHPLLSRAAAAARSAMTWLIRRGRLYPVSDSTLALEYWKRRAGVSHGAVVELPPPPGLGGQAPPPRSGGPVVALVGSFRSERGAQHYDTIIGAAVESLHAVTVHVQISAHVPEDVTQTAAMLRRTWEGDPRVVIHDGYLSDEAYARLLARTDVVALPYDAESYTTGTSGVLHEAVALGATVLTSPVAWAVQEYRDHPRVRFLERWDRESVRRELPSVTLTAVQTRSPESRLSAAAFAASWDTALREALDYLHALRSGAPPP